MTAGERLGPYEILKPIGAGGMGEVFQARDTRLDRLVAIKISHEQFTERFEREARAVAALNHAHICTLYDVGPNYLVMEYIDGKPLEGPLPLETAIRYAGQIASALEAAHRVGIVHRDLKPANILVTKSGVKLLDFGLATRSAGLLAAADSTTRTITEEGAIVGTLHYMSPEQLEGKPVDARSDIFSYGCVLYEMLTGRMAFAGESRASVIAAILERQPAPMADAPPGVSEAILRALEKDPDDRWQSARDLAGVLAIAARVSTGGTPAPPPSRRWLWPGIAGLLALVLAATVIALWPHKPPEEPRWTGAQLGGPAEAFGPRLSPVGSLVAFIALIDGQSQVAVLTPETGNWRALTHQKDLGQITGLAWSLDGAKIYFDRDTGVPAGVYSVPVLGGDSRLIAPAAGTPQVLSDGTLAVVRINAQRNPQVYRFHPDSGVFDPLPAITHGRMADPLRATPHGARLLFYGYQPDAGGARADPGLFAMNIDGSGVRRLAPGVALPRSAKTPVAFAGEDDGLHVILSVPAGSLYRVIEVPIDGGDSERTLFTSTMASWYLDTGDKGAIYSDQIFELQTLLRFPASGGTVERLSGTYNQNLTPVAVLPDGRVVVHVSSGGPGGMYVTQKDASLSPLLESGEACGPPATLLGADRVAVMTDRAGEIAIVSIGEGRVMRRLKVKHTPVASLAASPDGRTLYYASKGFVWSLPVEGGEESQVAAGDEVAVEPGGRSLVMAMAGQDSNRLTRLRIGEAQPEPITARGELPLPLASLTSQAVSKDGRIVVTTASPSRWFWTAGILDPRGGSFAAPPIAFDGEIVFPMWTPDGKIVAAGREYSFTLWRFKPGGK